MKKLTMFFGLLLMLPTIAYARNSSCSTTPNDYLGYDDFNDGNVNNSLWVNMTNPYHSLEKNGVMNFSGDNGVELGGMYANIGTVGANITIEYDFIHYSTLPDFTEHMGFSSSTTAPQDGQNSLHWYSQANVPKSRAKRSGAYSTPVQFVSSSNYIVGTTYHVQFVRFDNGSARIYWYNEDLSEFYSFGNVSSQDAPTPSTMMYVYFGGDRGTYNGKFAIDNFMVYNGTHCPTVTTGIPTLSGINCTSCNLPNGDTVSPYTTSDTTPTFKFSTNMNANCRVADENWNYTVMGSSRNCDGAGTESHSCPLTVQDELIYSTDYVYLACENSGTGQETFNASAKLQMEITSLSYNSSAYIEKGIENSVIWPGATIYSNQQVYLRNLNNNQLLATVDKVAVYGNQRWLFNVENSSELGLFNLTPVVYALDMVNVTLSNIEQQVSKLINSTKR